MSMRILGVIPARGGSKGLPGKNIRELAGLPLIGHSIRCAARCPEITKAIVSTDDARIADVARTLGGEVPWLRPAELARDDTPMMPVLRHALETMEAADGAMFDAVLLLDPTSPGRIPSDVERAAALLAEDPTADGVVACSRPTFNPLWVGVFAEDGYLKPAFDTGTHFVRRQDVPPFFRINGALYLWRREFVLSGEWPGGRQRMLEMPETRAFSIDDEHEFGLAELVLTSGLVELPWLGSMK